MSATPRSWQCRGSPGSSASARVLTRSTRVCAGERDVSIQHRRLGRLYQKRACHTHPAQVGWCSARFQPWYTGAQKAAAGSQLITGTWLICLTVRSGSHPRDLQLVVLVTVLAGDTAGARGRRSTARTHAIANQSKVGASLVSTGSSSQSSVNKHPAEPFFLSEQDINMYAWDAEWSAVKATSPGAGSASPRTPQPANARWSWSAKQSPSPEQLKVRPGTDIMCSMPAELNRIGPSRAPLDSVVCGNRERAESSARSICTLTTVELSSLAHPRPKVFIPSNT